MELQHHGIKGQKWGVRRFQYKDGTLTPSGKRRYGYEGDSISTKFRNSQDYYLDKGTTLKRIQTNDNFEKFAFYATHKKEDVDKYEGLFGKNLRDRANWETKKAESKYKKTKSQDDLDNFNKLKTYSDNLKVYQLNIKSMNKLRIPSDENASDVTFKLLKNKDFYDNAKYSIADSRTKMKRPQQQYLFDKAEKAMQKDLSELTYTDKLNIYKAINLSLVFHDDREVKLQDSLYKELKKKGYNALVDNNDKEFSSYHAKHPVIVFDTDSVKLDSITETNPKITNMLNKKYNKERIVKEIPANTVGFIGMKMKNTLSSCADYVDSRIKKFLG